MVTNNRRGPAVRLLTIFARCDTAQEVQRSRIMPRIIPAYRQRKGYDQAIVTLRDAVTRRARDYWLGPYNTPRNRDRQTWGRSVYS